MEKVKLFFIVVLSACACCFADTVWIDAGTYSTFPENVESGSAGNYKVYMGRGNSPSDVSIEQLDNWYVTANYIWFENMAFGQVPSTSQGGQNVDVQNSHHVHFKNCRFFRTNTGSSNPTSPQSATGDLLHFYKCDSVVVEYCEFTNEHPIVYGSIDHGLETFDCFNVICRNNHFHDMIYSNHAIVIFRGNSHSVLIENCVFDSIGGCHSLRFGGGGSKNYPSNSNAPAGTKMIARNNVFMNCPELVFEVYNATNIKIYNNTAVHCGTNGSGWEGGHGIVKVSGGPLNDSVWFYNNLIANPDGDLRSVIDVYKKAATFPEHIYLENNLIWNGGSPVTWNYWAGQYDVMKLDPTVTDKVKNTVMDDPKLENYLVELGTFDYRLKQGSPAIDAAKAVSEVTVDYNGGTRGASPDIGSFEYGSSASKIRRLKGSWNLPNLNPNPFTGQVQMLLPAWSGTGNLTVYDARGIRKKRVLLGSARQGISLGNNWPAGLYFLVFTDDQGIFTTQVIKQK